MIDPHSDVAGTLELLRSADEAEAIRRDFARSWGRIGSAWGIAGSTAAAQGYLLVHGGPLTRREIQAALGLSHRAALVALADCEAWGIVERAPEPRRGGRRGPAATAWLPVGDHVEWFRRVAEARMARETDPILPLLDDCLRRADAAGADDLRDRIEALLGFVRAFDHAVGAIVSASATDIGRLFDVLGRLDDETLARLLATLAAVPPDDLARAATSLAHMPPGLVRRVVALVARPEVARLVR